MPCLDQKHHVKQLLTDLDRVAQFTVRQQPCRAPQIAMLVARLKMPRSPGSDGSPTLQLDPWFTTAALTAAFAGILGERMRFEPLVPLETRCSYRPLGRAKPRDTAQPRSGRCDLVS